MKFQSTAVEINNSFNDLLPNGCRYLNLKVLRKSRNIKPGATREVVQPIALKLIAYPQTSTYVKKN